MVLAIIKLSAHQYLFQAIQMFNPSKLRINTQLSLSNAELDTFLLPLPIMFWIGTVLNDDVELTRLFEQALPRIASTTSTCR